MPNKIDDKIDTAEEIFDATLDEILLSEDWIDETIEDEDENEDEESGEGGKGKSGGGGKKPLKVNPKELKELIGDEYDTDKWLDKIKAIALGPFSTIIPGASAFDAESDLKKKLLMAEVGIITKQILPSDVVDPNLIQQLEARLNLRHNDVMQIAGQITNPVDNKITAATAILGTTAATIIAATAAKDNIEIKTTAQKNQTKVESKVDSRTDPKADLKVEVRADTENQKINDEIKIKLAENKQELKAIENEPQTKSINSFATTLDTTILVDKDILDPDLLDLIKNSQNDKYSFAAQIDDGVNTGKPTTQPTGELSLNEQFNRAVTEVTTPVQTVQLKQDAQFKLNDPSAVLRPDPDKFTF